MDSTPASSPTAHARRAKVSPWLIVGAVVIVAALIVGAFVLRALGQPAPAPSPTPTPTPSPSPSPSPAPSPTPTPTPEPVWPLTGRTGEIATRPAIAVKVENSIDARPQAGLEQADIVYEQLVEGGIARYIAVYHSQLPDLVAPIRSVRPMDGPIVSQLHPLLAFSGGQDRFLQRASQAGAQLISNDRGDAGFWRTSDRVAPHNVAGDVQAFLAQADSAHQDSPAPLFAYAQAGQASSIAAAGTPAGRVSAQLSGGATPNWTWDAGSGRWLRSEGSYPALSASGQQLAADHVICLSVEVRNEGGLDPAGNPIPETIVTGAGDGLLASAGAVMAIRWSKAGDSDPMVFTDAAGQPLVLSPGTTWFELTPVGSGGYSAQ